MNNPCVYISANGRPGNLCIGVTSDLLQHNWYTPSAATGPSSIPSDTPRLLWSEPHDSMDHAIARADELRQWPKLWLLQLIVIALEQKPFWHDL